MQANNQKQGEKKIRHARSFCGSYHDEECILTSVIASGSEGADDAEVTGVEIGYRDGGGGGGCSEEA